MREFIARKQQIFRDWLDECVSGVTDIEPINEAIKYSLNGGKRLRPILVMLAAEFMERSASELKHFAVGIECIHNYSLVHDDLPCMDNDTLRHSQPCTHVKYGEGMAVLTGDALLNLAYEIMLKAPEIDANYINAVKYAAAMAGVNGMIGGQCLDIADKDCVETFLRDIIKLNSLKTACLFKAALVGGVIALGASAEEIAALERYSDDLGIIFQIVDDILDSESTEAELGKNIGSDAAQNKITYLSIVGIDQARIDIKRYEADALNAISVFGKRADKLAELLNYLSSRSA